MTKRAEILLVEDNPGDARLTQEALREVEPPPVLHIVRDGIEAMAFLRRKPPYTGAPRPDLILLDLNLPGKNGREVLADVRADPALAVIPVVVLTSSSDEADVRKTYGLHANCFITKPVELEEYTRTIQAIEAFWFHVVRLPPP